MSSSPGPAVVVILPGGQDVTGRLLARQQADGGAWLTRWPSMCGRT
ncbi:hypothetical protein ABT160_44360 [Streptomyces sp. NPDC001941]